MEHLDKYVNGAVNELAQRLTLDHHGKSWSSLPKIPRSAVMELFTTRVSSMGPCIPINKCNGGWIGRQLLRQKWNNYARGNGNSQPKPKKGKTRATALSNTGNDCARYVIALGILLYI